MKKLLVSLLGGFSTFFFTVLAFAQEAGTPTGALVNGSAIALGAAVVVGIAVLGGTFSQGRAAAAALEGIARNPGAANKIQTPMILALALIESLVILAWVIGFIMIGKF